MGFWKIRHQVGQPSGGLACDAGNIDRDGSWVTGIDGDRYRAGAGSPDRIQRAWVTRVLDEDPVARADIGTRLGPGPRDGLMTGLVRRTGESVRLVRTVIEVAVVATGWAFGGTLGITTVLYTLAIGPLVQIFLPRLTVPAIGGLTGPSREVAPARSINTPQPRPSAACQIATWRLTPRSTRG